MFEATALGVTYCSSRRKLLHLFYYRVSGEWAFSDNLLLELNEK